AFPVHLDRLDEAPFGQPGHGVIHRRLPDAEGAVMPPLPHQGPHLVRVHRPLVEQAEHRQCHGRPRQRPMAPRLTVVTHRLITYSVSITQRRVYLDYISSYRRGRKSLTDPAGGDQAKPRQPWLSSARRTTANTRRKGKMVPNGCGGYAAATRSPYSRTNAAACSASSAASTGRSVVPLVHSSTGFSPGRMCR